MPHAPKHNSPLKNDSTSLQNQSNRTKEYKNAKVDYSDSNINSNMSKITFLKYYKNQNFESFVTSSLLSSFVYTQQWRQGKNVSQKIIT